MNDSTPWYVKFTYTYGIPSVIAIYLLYFIVNTMDARLLGVNTKLDIIRESLIEHKADMNRSIEATAVMNGQMVFTNLILQRICVNTASSPVERNNCFGPTAVTRER